MELSRNRAAQLILMATVALALAQAGCCPGPFCTTACNTTNCPAPNNLCVNGSCTPACSSLNCPAPNTCGPNNVCNPPPACSLANCGSPNICVNNVCTPPPPPKCSPANCSLPNACDGNGVCSPVMVNQLQVHFHTNGDNKNADTGIAVNIDGVTSWTQVQPEEFYSNTDTTKIFNPSTVRLGDLQGHQMSVCIAPSGKDNWEFNVSVTGKRSDGPDYVFASPNHWLDQGNRCNNFILP